MNDLEIKIINELKYYHRGKGNAIHYKHLALTLNLNERELRNIVSGIIKSAKAPLCSISSGDGGYFFPESEDEFNYSQAEDMSRIKELAKKHRGRRIAWINYMQEKQDYKPKQLVML
jgi:oligoribonuclease (3'-5' exoribonuclease)